MPRCTEHVTSRPPTYSYGYTAKSPAIPRASARQYVPRSVPCLQKDRGRYHCTYLYRHVIRRHCNPVTIATSPSAQALPTCHVVITILYTCSSVVNSLTQTPIRTTCLTHQICTLHYMHINSFSYHLLRGITSLVTST